MARARERESAVDAIKHHAGAPGHGQATGVFLKNKTESVFHEISLRLPHNLPLLPNKEAAEQKQTRGSRVGTPAGV